MNTDALQHLRQKLNSNQAVYGLWVTLESPSITEMAVALGLDWVVLDAEHGHLDWHDLVNHLRAVVRSKTVCLIRVAELNVALIKRALDIGADGIVVPWIETLDQVRDAVRFAHYPPRGMRGIGSERATCWGQCLAEHVSQAEQNVLVVPIIETVEAGRRAAQLAAVDGTEIFFFGPADYSSTAGYPGQWEGPGVAEQIEAARTAICAAGKYCGVIATDNDNLRQRREQGFLMLGLGLDGGLLLRSLHNVLESAGSDRMIEPGFTLENHPSNQAEPPSVCPPESMRPDRPEVMTRVGDGKRITISPGVSFEYTLGQFNGARNLTTGFLTLAPGVVFPYHTYEFSRSLTLLEGSAVVEVEGRRYDISTLDNVMIPRGFAHSASNTNGNESAKLHIAMPTDQATHTPIDKFFSKRAMPKESTGYPGAERVTRFSSADRYSPEPNTTFIDYFNANLMPGLEMSGGYGIFEYGGRSPAHIHDSDESICIVQGNARCVVEGRQYDLSERATALQPCGRIHYFINHTQEPMAMIWVCAGPLPQRLAVDDRYATVEHSPWR